MPVGATGRPRASASRRRRLARGALEGVGHLVRGRGHGRDEEDDDGVDLRVGEQDRQRRSYVSAVAPPSMSTGFARLASGGERGAEALARLVVELRQLETRGIARVRAEDPEAARVREDRDPPALRLGLAREQRGDVDQLLQGPGPDHAGLAEERVDRGVRARERRRVRARGALPGAS